MSKAARLFNRLTAILIGLLLACPPVGFSQEAGNIKKSETSFYQEVFDQNFFYEGTSYLRFDRLYRALTGKKVRAKNVNAFDEIPDNTLFVNRHARNPLSPTDLEKGFQENSGPDAKEKLTVLRVEFLGTQPGFFLIRDSRGDEYELSFDPFDHLELVTSSEVIASRFFHAIGYNVSPFTILTFEPGQLAVGENAVVIDNSGFEKNLTEEALQQNILFLPTDGGGKLRAAARKAIQGTDKGHFRFRGRRAEDPNDRIEHQDRRDVRALRIFSSWLGNYRLSETNTKDFLVEENGRKILKHYLIRFNYALGSAADDAKPPMLTHEYLVDFGEALKSFFTLGLREKPWQKRWRETDEQAHPSSTIGYFDNREFSPRGFKTELPFYSYKDLTRADAFWAAKIIMSFSNDDIRAMVKAGKLSEPEDETRLADTLAKRRDLIGRYWFEQASPLDKFNLKNNVLTWEDLAVKHGFENQAGTVYHVKAFAKQKTCTCRHGKPISSFETIQASTDLGKLLAPNEPITLKIRTTRQNAAASKRTPYVAVKLNSNGILSVRHQD